MTSLSPFQPAELDPGATPIPDASEWAMVILALGGAGLMAWSRLARRGSVSQGGRV